MKKPKLKFLVDVLLFVDLCSIAATGLILGYVIPPGHGHGGHRRFLGLGRHDWGDIHLNLSLAILLLLALHLALNWRWVTGAAQRHLGARWQRLLGLISLAWIAVLAFGWLLARCS